MTGGGDGHPPRPLNNLDVGELFAELERLGNLQPPPSGGRLHTLQIDQVELELCARELGETVDDLSQSLEAFARLFYDAPGAYLAVGADRRIGRANQAAQQLLRRSEAQLVGVPLAQLFRLQYQSTLARALAAAERSEGAANPARRSRLITLLNGVSLHANIAAHVDVSARLEGYRLLLLPIAAPGPARRRRRKMMSHARLVIAAAAGVEELCAGVARAMAAEFAAIGLVDLMAEDGQLIRQASASEARADSRLAAGRISPLSGRQGWKCVQQQVIASGIPLLLRRHREDRAEVPAADDLSARWVLSSWLVVPVSVQDKIIGSLTFLAAKGSREFSPRDLRCACRLGRQLGSALQQAR